MNDLAQSNSSLIPTLDIGDYLANKSGAQEALASQLRTAMEKVGFYILVNHGVAMTRINETLEAVKRFHALPLDDKLAMKGNEHNIGYMAVNSSVSRASQVESDKPKKPNFVEAFFVKRDLPPNHPDVLANKLFRPANMWPDETVLPGFRPSILAYCESMEAL